MQMIGTFLKKEEQDKLNVWLTLAEKHKQEGNYVVCDFICPTPKARELFNADYTIWMDTIDKGRFEDTNAMFVKPKKFDFKVTTYDAETWATQISEKIK